MSTSDANSRMSTKQVYKTKPAMQDEPTMTESSSFPDYEQPFAPTSKQLRERMAHAKASGFTQSEDSNFVEKESELKEEVEFSYGKLKFEKEKSESENRSEFEEGDDSDSDRTPKKESLKNKKKKQF